MLSYQQLLSKVTHLAEKDKKRSAQLKKERRKLTTAKKTICSLRGERNENAKEKKALKRKQKRQNTVNMGIVPTGYHFPIGIIQLCMLLRIQGGCSFRGVVRVLEIMKNYGTWIEIPCANTVENWVQKVGCFLLLAAKKEDKKLEPKCLIIDESIGIGQERMLCILSAPSEQKKEQCLALTEVKVELMCSQKSWTGEEVEVKLKELGESVKYVVSDGGKNLKKGIKDASLIRVPDVSHELAKCLEKTFMKQVDFEAFGKLLRYWQTSGVQTEHAYLLPPKQRAVARFMNLWKVVKWAIKLMPQLSKLPKKTADFFAPLASQKPFVRLLGGCLGISKIVLNHLKTNGLNLKTLKFCWDYLLKKKSQNTQERAIFFINLVQDYLQSLFQIVQKQPTLMDSSTAWYCCSEVIESFFGKYKSGLATNTLCGISALSLEMPLHTKQGQILQHPKALITALEAISHPKLTTWMATYLLENKALRRQKILKKKNKIL